MRSSPSWRDGPGADQDHEKQLAAEVAAARSEPELAELLARLHADRLRNLRVRVGALAANGPLRLPDDEVVESVSALTPELLISPR